MVPSRYCKVRMFQTIMICRNFPPHDQIYMVVPVSKTRFCVSIFLLNWLGIWYCKSTKSHLQENRDITTPFFMSWRVNKKLGSPKFCFIVRTLDSCSSLKKVLFSITLTWYFLVHTWVQRDHRDHFFFFHWWSQIWLPKQHTMMKDWRSILVTWKPWWTGCPSESSRSGPT